MYGEYSAKKLVVSYSAAVRRQNGVLDIQAAFEGLSNHISAAAEKLLVAQTDERYLHNLALRLPQNCSGVELLSLLEQSLAALA